MNRQLLTIGVVLAALVYALVNYWPTIFPAATQGPTPTTLPIVDQVAGSPKKAVKEVNENLTAAQINLADPFVVKIGVKKKDATPATVDQVKPAEPVLEGVWVDSGMRVAFISGQSLPVGGKIMGYRIISILKDQVILEKGGHIKTLKMEAK